MSKNSIPSPKGKQKIYLDISEERGRQNAKWGGATHDDLHDVDDWFDYVRNQMANVEQEWDGADENFVRQAYIKIAALAVAAAESFDRRRAAGLDPVNNSLVAR